MFTKDYGEGIVLVVDPDAQGKFKITCERLGLQSYVETMEDIKTVDEKLQDAACAMQLSRELCTIDLLKLGFTLVGI